MAAVDHPEITRAAMLVRRFSADETARHEADSRWKFQYDQWAREHYAREEGEQTGLEKGERIGLAKGERIGLEKGVQIGRDEGSTSARYDTAQRALQMGLSPEQVSQITGLSVADVTEVARRDLDER